MGGDHLKDVMYQVFISSSYLDLVDEREQVITTLLKGGFIPSSMEMFPSTTGDKWEYIKYVIDACDYFILILKGKYGSGYTEKEYRYALDKKKPVLAFVYDNLSDLQAKYFDEEQDLKEKFNHFREEIMNTKLVSLWNNKDKLCLSILQSLNMEIERNPEVGWIRRSSVTSDSEANQLMKENIGLKEELEKIKADSDQILATGNDLIQIRIKSEIGNPILSFTCNELMIILKAEFNKGIYNEQLKGYIESWIYSKIGMVSIDGDTLNKVTNVITNQFQAIGWIECTTSSGSYFIGDTEYYAYDELYWFVTDEGLGQYVRSSAIRRNQGVVNLN